MKGSALLSITTLLHEKSSIYTNHDRLFKELIRTFFQEFVEAFFPREYEYIDFSHTIFLEQEIFTDIVKGEKREVDILVETKLQGEETVLLVHIEPQSYFQKEFHERMFIYASRLYEKHRKPVLPIAVFSYNDPREVPNQFTITFPTFNVLSFHYLQLHLINSDWRSYIRSNNPAAAALLSKMGYTKHERIHVKLEFLRMLSRMKLNPAKMELLYGFFETYLRLNEEEERKMREEITKLPDQEVTQVLKLPNSYYEKGMEKGKEQLVLEMIKKGLSEELIAEIAKMDIEKVRGLKEKLNNF